MAVVLKPASLQEEPPHVTQHKFVCLMHSARLPAWSVSHAAVSKDTGCGLRSAPISLTPVGPARLSLFIPNGEDPRVRCASLPSAGREGKSAGQARRHAESRSKRQRALREACSRVPGDLISGCRV
ncbi:unnamed protein product [Rangifer tarandus platyrhynchus]|uniref:Uncharacterized protein n=2 Tax=Rangifer tarandus platyrhynchus TaxID=3082113 RepID=A0ACB0E8K1_RANTA|nr:unnamed protein product [Rangifer tarandus platyrhynchus]CAI9696769.1 unnamed protein product [Rangifer tarandus platyrhynchus]